VGLALLYHIVIWKLSKPKRSLIAVAERLTSAFRAMLKANLTEPTNPLTSGVAYSMSEETFARLVRSLVIKSMKNPISLAGFHAFNHFALQFFIG